MKEKSNYNSPFGISWNELRKELLTPEEISCKIINFLVDNPSSKC